MGRKYFWEPTVFVARWGRRPSHRFCAASGTRRRPVLRQTDDRPTVLIGKDTRISGYMLESAGVRV